MRFNAHASKDSTNHATSNLLPPTHRRIDNTYCTENIVSVVVVIIKNKILFSSFHLISYLEGSPLLFLSSLTMTHCRSSPSLSPWSSSPKMPRPTAAPMQRGPLALDNAARRRRRQRLGSSYVRCRALSSVRTISGGICPSDFSFFSLSRRPGSTSLSLDRPQLNFDGGGGRATSSVKPAKLNAVRGQKREQTRRASQNSLSMESSEIMRGRE